jgi:hypothetical protein
MSENYIIKYPLDLTGTSPENNVLGELHALEPGINRAAVPRYGAFYTESLVVRDTIDGSVLVKNDQYVPIMYYADPSERSGKEVCAGVIVTDGTVSSEISIDYQVVGGDYANITQVIIDLINNLNLDDREVMWGDLLGRPDAFPPAQHLHDIGDIYGFEFVVQALNEVREAILLGDIASHDELKAMIEDRYQKALDRAEEVRDELNAHEARTDNPHVVTKAQVGLGLVSNYSTSTEAEARAGTSNARFMTSLRVAEAIETQALTPLNSHTARIDNPHSVTKAQVGLSQVSNYPDASVAEAEGGSVTNRFITPATLNAGVEALFGVTMTAHIDNESNPHNVTKAQTGLGNVQNYSMSSVVEAREGTRGDRYMSPSSVAEAIQVQITDAFTAHATATNNPHQVTKGQVGLGSVDNFPVANTAEAEAGTANNRYMTPSKVRDAIESIAGDQLSAHVGDLSNPHQVTKAQVGLGSVENYRVALTSEAVAGTRDDVYMTPLLVSNKLNAEFTNRLGGYVQKNTAESLSLREIGGNLQAFVSGGWRTVWPPQWQ